MKLFLKSMLTGLALLAILPSLALANGRGPGGHSGFGARGVYVAPAWRGNIRNFGHHDVNIWRGGGWRHTNYGGRLGWWWVVGGSYYLYQQPIYPYPDPYQPSVVYVEPQQQVVVAPQAPQVYAPQQAPPQQAAPQTVAQYWHFCDASQTYYPYVATCEGGWRAVPATPPGAPQ
jgi:hypothetical protein